MHRHLLVVGCLASALGCGDLGGDLDRRQASGSIGGVGLEGAGLDSAASAGAPQSPLPPASGTAPLPGGVPGVVPPGGAPLAPPLPGVPGVAPSAAAPLLEPAQAGVTGRGDYAPGLITTPVAAYFNAQERIVFEIQIPHAMQLFQATNGFFPKSQEEFMQQIIEANQIPLPKLPPGCEYVYDPETAQLLVQHPQ